jgi:hypothetical protein
VSEAVLVVPA